MEAVVLIPEVTWPDPEGDDGVVKVGTSGAGYQRGPAQLCPRKLLAARL